MGDAGQDADVAAGVHVNGALMQRIEARRRVQIGRLDPALARSRHAANQDGNFRGRTKPCEVIAQHRRKAGAGTVQHALTASALREHATLRRHQPAAKAAGAPINRDEGGRRSAGGTCNRRQTTLPGKRYVHEVRIRGSLAAYELT